MTIDAQPAKVESFSWYLYKPQLEGKHIEDYLSACYKQAPSSPAARPIAAVHPVMMENAAFEEAEAPEMFADDDEDDAPAKPPGLQLRVGYCLPYSLASSLVVCVIGCMKVTINCDSSLKM